MMSTQAYVLRSAALNFSAFDLIDLRVSRFRGIMDLRLRLHAYVDPNVLQRPALYI
jgi:hypothetical protein